MNPRLVAQHTISSRADSAALALLRDCSLVRLTIHVWPRPYPPRPSPGGPSTTEPTALLRRGHPIKVVVADEARFVEHPVRRAPSQRVNAPRPAPIRAPTNQPWAKLNGGTGLDFGDQAVTKQSTATSLKTLNEPAYSVRRRPLPPAAPAGRSRRPLPPAVATLTRPLPVHRSKARGTSRPEAPARRTQQSDHAAARRGRGGPIVDTRQTDDGSRGVSSVPPRHGPGGV